MTSMRERIQNLPPVVSYGVVTVIVLGAVVSIVMKGRNDQSLPPAIAERMVYRQCAGCGHIEENKFAELVEKRWIAADQALGPRGEGARCPQCQRDQMIFVLKCPSDGAVFQLLITMESYIAGMKIHLTLRSAPSANGILSWWNPLGKNKLEHKAVDDPFRVTTPLQLVTKGKGSRRVVDVDHLVAKRTTIRAVQRRRRVTDLQHDIPLGSLAQTPKCMLR